MFVLVAKRHKHARQAKFEMFVNQSLYVWPGLKIRLFPDSSTDIVMVKPSKMHKTGLQLFRQYEIPWLFPNFSRPRLSSTVSRRPFRGVWGHAPAENFQNYDLQLGWKWISDNKIPWLFPDFWNSVANSLTFRGPFQIPWLFQVFQVSGNPDKIHVCEKLPFKITYCH